METIAFNINHPGKFVFNRLRQLIQKENFKIGTNDPLDFLHAVVPLGYADFVLLDKHWADLANKLKSPLRESEFIVRSRSISSWKTWSCLIKIILARDGVGYSGRDE
jgi:hypothetical protein